MATQPSNLPQVGDPVPAFTVTYSDEVVEFPNQFLGNWCILFAHPANFTTAWTMFSAYLSMKERWLNERNTKVIAISNEPIGGLDNWSNKAKRFLGIYLKAPFIEDLDFSLSKIYGIASGRRPQPGCERLALIIDPNGIIRMIINRPLPNIETALIDLERQFEILQGNIQEVVAESTIENHASLEQSDCTGMPYKPKPAYFQKKHWIQN